MVTAFILFVLFLIVVAIFQVFYNRIWGDHPEAFPFTEVLNRHNATERDHPENFARAAMLIDWYLGNEIIGSDVFQITVGDVEVAFWIYDIDAENRRFVRRLGEEVSYRVERFPRDHLE